MRNLARKPFRRPSPSRTGAVAQEERTPGRRRREAMERFADRILDRGKRHAPRSCPVCRRVFTPKRAEVQYCNLSCFGREHDRSRSAKTTQVT